MLLVGQAQGVKSVAKVPHRRQGQQGRTAAGNKVDDQAMTIGLFSQIDDALCGADTLGVGNWMAGFKKSYDAQVLAMPILNNDATIAQTCPEDILQGSRHGCCSLAHSQHHDPLIVIKIKNQVALQLAQAQNSWKTVNAPICPAGLAANFSPYSCLPVGSSSVSGSP